MLTPLNILMLNSCSDEPDSEYFYTFTGEMMSDWPNPRPSPAVKAATDSLLI